MYRQFSRQESIRKRESETNAKLVTTKKFKDKLIARKQSSIQAQTDKPSQTRPGTINKTNTSVRSTPGRTPKFINKHLNQEIFYDYKCKNLINFKYRVHLFQRRRLYCAFATFFGLLDRF